MCNHLRQRIMRLPFSFLPFRWCVVVSLPFRYLVVTESLLGFLLLVEHKQEGVLVQAQEQGQVQGHYLHRRHLTEVREQEQVPLGEQGQAQVSVWVLEWVSVWE